MADVASKQQTTALFLSTIDTCKRRQTELTNLMGNLCCAREHSVQFLRAVFFHSLSYSVWRPLQIKIQTGSKKIKKVKKIKKNKLGVHYMEKLKQLSKQLLSAKKSTQEAFL
jgi:hypothetical protein